MSTSGTATYSINRDVLIASAFRTLGVFNDDSQAPPSDIAYAAQTLNLMIKQWHQEGYPLWTVKNVTVPLVVGASVYSIGPTGTVQTDRPIKVIEARLSYLNGGLDVPLQMMSRQEYNQVGNKYTQGTPNSFYYDPQLGNGLLYVNIPATALLAGGLSDYFEVDYGPATYESSGTGIPNVLNLTVQRPLMDMTNGTDDFDFPAEALNALKFGLAAELTTDYDVPASKMQIIMAKAEKLREKLFDASVEEASTFFTFNRWH